jgi:hypothetical protein
MWSITSKCAYLASGRTFVLLGSTKYFYPFKVKPLARGRIIMALSIKRRDFSARLVVIAISLALCLAVWFKVAAADRANSSFRFSVLHTQDVSSATHQPSRYEKSDLEGW